jgi:hypothetical protein
VGRTRTLVNLAHGLFKGHPDRVANYWKSQLENGSKVRQNTALTFIGVLARRNLTAKEILRKFFETVDLTDPYWEGLKERYDDEIYK